MLKVPRRVGRYELLDRIGVGGMAEVYRARRPGDPREYAVKQLTEELSRDPLLVSMFTDEANIASQLAHPNIVQVVEYGEDAGRVYMVLEYIDGHDLRWVLATAARTQYWIPVEFSLTVARDLCRALAHAHEARSQDGQPLQIVHRDVSHSNVFVSRRGEVKLADFGIARARGRQSQTRTGLVKGKLGYLSPEQVRAEKLDGRSDLFAATIVLWELLTQRRMFVGETDFKTMLAVCSDQRVPPSVYRPGLPPGIDEVVLRGLSVRREARYATAREMERVIESVAAEFGLGLGSTIVTQVLDYLDQTAKKLSRPPEPPPPPLVIPEPPIRQQDTPILIKKVFKTGELQMPPSAPPSDTFAKPPADGENETETENQALSDPAMVDFVAGSSGSSAASPSPPGGVPVAPATSSAYSSTPRAEPPPQAPRPLPSFLPDPRDRVRASQSSFQNLPVYLRSGKEIRPLVAFDSMLFALDPRIRKPGDAFSADRSRWMPAEELALKAGMDFGIELRDPAEPVQKSLCSGTRIVGVIGDLSVNGFTGRLIVDREELRLVALLQAGALVGVLSSMPDHQLLPTLTAARVLPDARAIARVLHTVMMQGARIDDILERELKVPRETIAAYREALSHEIFESLLRPGESIFAYEKSAGWPARAPLAGSALEMVVTASAHAWSDDSLDRALAPFLHHRLQLMPGFPMVARTMRLKQDAAPALRRFQAGRTLEEILSRPAENPDQLRMAKRLLVIFAETGGIGFVR